MAVHVIRVDTAVIASSRWAHVQLARCAAPLVDTESERHARGSDAARVPASLGVAATDALDARARAVDPAALGALAQPTVQRQLNTIAEDRRTARHRAYRERRV